MKDTDIIEAQFIAKTAAEYLSRGYEVWEEIPLDFMPHYRADLLVRKDGETKVIEVKTRTSLAITPAIEQLAEVINAKPNWSFELVVVGEPERLDAPENAQPFTSENIDRCIDQAEKALAAGFAEAAFLMAWSACEAAVRVLVAAEGVEIERVTHSGYILSHAVFHGAISRNDDEYLSGMLAYRNAIVHGFAVNDFDNERVKELITAAKKLQRASVAAEHSDLPDEQAQPVDIVAMLGAAARPKEFSGT